MWSAECGMRSAEFFPSTAGTWLSEFIAKLSPDDALEGKDS
jgi:hypothetical protein